MTKTDKAVPFTGYMRVLSKRETQLRDDVKQCEKIAVALRKLERRILKRNLTDGKTKKFLNQIQNQERFYRKLAAGYDDAARQEAQRPSEPPPSIGWTVLEEVIKHTPKSETQTRSPQTTTNPIEESS